MESNDNNILDKQLKEKLYDQEVSPPDFMWDKIEDELGAPKSNKFPFSILKFFSIVAVVSSIALFYGLLKDADKSEDKLLLKSHVSKNEQSKLTHDSNNEDIQNTYHSKDYQDKKELTTNSTTENEHISTQVNDEHNTLKNDNRTDRESEKKKVLMNQIKTNTSKLNTLAQKDFKSNQKSADKMNAFKSSTQNNNVLIVGKITNINNDSKNKTNPKANKNTTKTNSGNSKLQNVELTKGTTPLESKLKRDNEINTKENVSSLNIQNKVLEKEPNLEKKQSAELSVQSNNEVKDNLNLESKKENINLRNESNKLNKEVVLELNKEVVLDKLADKNIDQSEQKNNINPVINDVTIKDSTSLKSNDTLDSKSKVEQLKKKSLFNLSSQGITIGALFYPNGAGLNYDYSGSTPSLSKKISVSSKSFMVNLLYKLGITPSWSFNTGINYQHYSIDALQTNTSEKIVLDSVQKFRSIKTFIGFDSTSHDSLFTIITQSYFDVSQRGEKSTSNVLKKNQVAYLGIPIEVSFQKQVYGKIQFLALLGFRMQFLVYQNIGKIDDLTELKSSSKIFNYYGSFGIGYKLNDQISLNAFLNMNVLNSGQLSINSSNSNTKIAYSPELRMTWNFLK